MPAHRKMALMTEDLAKAPPSLDLRHVGRVHDKEMAVEHAGMEMSKPGTPDLRRRKYTVALPNRPNTEGADIPPQTDR
jgi:hypothetical protein